MATKRDPGMTLRLSSVIEVTSRSGPCTAKSRARIESSILDIVVLDHLRRNGGAEASDPPKRSNGGIEGTGARMAS
jgi:hypothetical protein